MKRFRILITIIAVGLLMAVSTQSCTNLDEELFDQVLPEDWFQTDAQFVSTLAAAYSRLNNYASGSYLSLSEASTDAMVVPTRGQDWDDGGHWRRLTLHSWNFEDPEPNGVWGFGFGGVSSCNQIIYNIEQLVEEGRADPETSAVFIAELEVLRAFYYYTLVDIYGNVPIVTEFVGADPTPPSNTRKEVFDFIVSEINKNIDLLSKAVDQTTYARMNHYAAQMLLAKVYMNANVWVGEEMYDKALDALNEIINSGKYTLEPNFFNNFDANNSGSKEFIVAIPFDQVFFQGFNLNMRTLHYGSQDTYNLTAQPWNGFCSLEEFYNSFEDIDLRKGQKGTTDGPYTGRGTFIAGFQYKSDGTPVVDSGADVNDPDGPHLNFMPEVNELGPQALRQAGARIGKWEFEVGSTQNMNNDFAIFRYADVLLLKAEALWRISGNAQEGEALALVNQVRITHGGTGLLPISTLDGEVSWLGQVIPGGELLNERGREMAYESSRRQDLLRWGIYHNPDLWTPPVNSPGDVISKDEFRKLFPIPRGQLDANPNLQQNPGYPSGAGG